MTNAFMLALLMTLSPNDPIFIVQSTLQGLYDEVDQATLQFETASDVDLYHAVRYSPDWAFVDAQGKRHTWAELRPLAIAALAERDDWLTDSIVKVMSSDGNRVTALVTETVVKKTEGETTSYRDTWVRAGESWKIEAREQLGASKKAPYRPYED